MEGVLLPVVREGFWSTPDEDMLQLKVVELTTPWQDNTLRRMRLDEIYAPSTLAELACVYSRYLVEQGKNEDWDFSILTHLLLFNSVGRGWFIS